MRAMIAGFQHPAQRELLAPFAPRYFDALEGMWASRETEVAIAFTSGLYPRVLIGPETVELTDRYLNDRRPAPAIRRLLSEGRDDVQRAMRARAKDGSSSA